jgi:hypothetical protein
MHAKNLVLDDGCNREPIKHLIVRHRHGKTIEGQTTLMRSQIASPAVLPKRTRHSSRNPYILFTSRSSWLPGEAKMSKGEQERQEQQDGLAGH